MIEAVDGDLEIRVAVTIAGDEVEIDFAGTAPQYPGNLNCPLAVTRSACFFVVRLVTEPDIPASGGAFVPVAVRAPEGSLVNARAPAAVVAGNTETSSRITDVVMAAFGQAVEVPAQGAGTMSNTTFGTSRWAYYETIGGGQGASPHADGPSAVHVAMSNALNTPVEALELAYPLRVERYALRLGSGGDGRHRGGDGVVRELRALEECRLSVLGDRRRHAPAGARGGGPGARGSHACERRRDPGQGHPRPRRQETSCARRPPEAAASARAEPDPSSLGAMCRNIRTFTTSSRPRPTTRCTRPRCSTFARSAARRSRRRRTRRRSSGPCDEIAHVSRHLLDDLVTSLRPRDREREAARARARAAQRFGRLARLRGFREPSASGTLVGRGGWLAAP